MKIQIITLFPEMFEGVLSASMLGIAKEKGLVSYELINLRDFGLGPRKQVDDTPYGGGSGMVLKPEPVVSAIEKAKQTNPKAKVILPTPRGKSFVQKTARSLSQETGLILICPRYEGYDERIVNWVDLQLRIGDYVLTGGELPSMVIIDSVVRLLPGVLGNELSPKNESFENENVIEHPHYTRPEVFEGLSVPETLLSGHHEEIEKWRSENSL
ncbi:MAG TPA: tRNA (guanosine(37)-N1)-methyltransferase TrmD [Candidatus Sulfotelmatobacter sp.]|nr:tRNA (guanosine(37)-N1)-methyltransferase TrmD [Candidatus Sulfotelmatobacter sp.]